MRPGGTYAAPREACAERLRWKSQLVRRLYERQYSREEIVALFRMIDWMMLLPKKHAILFEADLDSIEAEFNMPYLSSIERSALQKGIEQGRTEGIEKGRTEGMQRGIEKGRTEGMLNDN